MGEQWALQARGIVKGKAIRREGRGPSSAPHSFWGRVVYYFASHVIAGYESNSRIETILTLC